MNILLAHAHLNWPEVVAIAVIMIVGWPLSRMIFRS
jgi:hypothetical protein